ncbi:MAG: ABC transporter permease [Spirochaetales bacterium]|nr:ABC transporter permease [Spirochaetales bacterium]
MSRRKVLTVIGIVLLLGFAVMAAIPSAIAPYGQKEMFQSWLNPSPEHPLGTNRLGYDIMTEMIYGTRTTLVTGLLSSLISLALGAAVGALAAEEGFIGRMVDGLIDVMAMLPKLVVLIVLGSFIRGGGLSLIILISVFSWSSTARTVRARVIELKHSAFTENLRIEGFSDFHILVRHTIPNTSDILVSRFLLGLNSCIMMESTLSFLGFGDTFHPTWGTMVNMAYRNGAFIRQAYAYLLSPGICIMLLSLSFYFMSIHFSSRKEEVEEVI